MDHFRRLFFVALLAGSLSGLLISAAHQWGAVPIILEAEIFEKAAEAHDAAAREPATEHQHGDKAWEPEDGAERTAYTGLADLLTGIGFALLLVAGYALRGGTMDGRRGLAWGLAGFAAFTLAPSLGLPPELPGTAAAELSARQLWWAGTVLSTGGGLALLAFGRRPSLTLVAAALIALPHLIGAPQPELPSSAAPDALAHRFILVATATSLLFWLCLGASTGALYRRLCRMACWVVLGLLAVAHPALAEDDGAGDKGFWERDRLTGDWGGLRGTLADSGVELTATYTAETLRNLSGGIRRRSVAAGLLQGDLDVDLEKLAGWRGGRIHASALHIQGRQLTANFIGGLIPVSSIEAAPSTRLFSLWMEQSLLDDLASVRFGQMPMQEEFFTSTYAAYMVNSAFGWPAIYAADMPSGGGGYPMGNAGVRLKVRPTPELSLLAAVFSGNVAPGINAGNDAQKRNRSGTEFTADEAPVWFGEAGYAVNQDRDADGLPASVKLGGWYYNGRALDQRHDGGGLSLGSAASSGVARSHHGNWAIYGILDHMLWKRAGTADSGVGAFFRTTYMPGDRNQMSYWLDTGLTLKGTFEGRDDDVAGLSFAYGRMSGDLAARDADARRFGTATAPDHDFEAVAEVMYSYQMTPWWSVIGDAQYLLHPGGGATLPENGSKAIPDATVLGLRSVFKL